jgi:hypothetical protein
MRVNNFSLIPLLFAGLLLAIGIAGCNSRPFLTSSVSGVLSVPVTGEQHYEEYEADGDFGDNFTGAKEIEYEDTAHGTISPSGDVDYFSFYGTADDSVVIDIDAEAFGSGLDSYIYLYDSSQVMIDDNDDYPDGWPDDPAHYIFVLDSHIEATLDTTGTHYIKVDGYGTTSGSYRLRLFNYDSGGMSAGTGGLRADAEFVPDEIIVKYKPGFDTQSVKGLSSQSAYRLSRSNGDTPGGALDVLKLDGHRSRLLQYGPGPYRKRRGSTRSPMSNMRSRTTSCGRRPPRTIRTTDFNGTIPSSGSTRYGMNI